MVRLTNNSLHLLNGFQWSIYTQITDQLIIAGCIKQDQPNTMKKLKARLYKNTHRPMPEINRVELTI